jgi:hypothetical protein
MEKKGLIFIPDISGLNSDSVKPRRCFMQSVFPLSGTSSAVYKNEMLKMPTLRTCVAILSQR